MSVLADLFAQLALLSLLAFGGITAMLPELHRLVVEQRHWMDDTTFSHMFAIAQAAPGPNLLVVSLIGWKVAGIPGAIVATVAISLPMSFLIFYLDKRLLNIQANRWSRSIQIGIEPLAVGLVCASGWLIGASAGFGWSGILACVASTCLMLLRNWHPLWYIAAGAIAGASGLI